MLESKDFATGCLTLLLCAILVPVFVFLFNLTFALAALLAVAVAAILGITLIGRLVRFFFTGK